MPNLKPRDLYDDTLARPKPPTPSGTATPKPGQPRPTTTSQLADRYHATPRPRGDGPEVKPADSSIHVGGRPSTGPGRPRPTLVTDRYTTQPTPAGPRDTTLPGGVRPSGVRPTLTPRPATGTRGVTTLVAGTAPHLVARPRTTTSVLSSPHRSNFGSCFGPVWDPCWSWSNQWSNHCSPTLTWSLGIGSGSFCWGWSSWFGSHCHRRYSSPFYGYYGSYGYTSAWWDPCWYRPYSSPCWWWPRSYYAPSYLYVQPAPSTVVVYDDSTPAVTETIVVGGDSSRSMTPEERGRRYLALGDFYFREGRFREAADTYAKARTLLPDDATIHFVLADAVFALGDYHFAAFLIGEGLRLDPNLADADTDKRLLYGDPKVFETQMQTLVRYLDEKPYDAMAHLVLGYNLKFSDNRKDAEKAFRRVLEIDPESHAARLLLESLTAPAPKAGDAPAAAPVEPAKSDR